jgi:hypothetical protein
MDTHDRMFGKAGQIGNPWKHPVDHPDIAYVSWFAEPNAQSTCEAAFFDHDDNWYVQTVDVFADYADGEAVGGTRVYRYIPRELLVDWLRIYAPYKQPEKAL